MKNGFKLAPQIILLVYFFIFLSTEVLSLFNLLNRATILVADTAFFSYLFLYLVKKTKSVASFRKIKNFFKQNLLISVSLLLLLTLTFLQGLLSAPNTTDAMVYHLPRVMYWIQNGTVHQTYQYTVHDFIGPFGSYMLLHLYLLFGGDRFLFFSQWFAFFVIVFMTHEFSEKFTKNKELIKITILLVTSLPIIVLQSTSTQTDLITAALFMLALYFAHERKVLWLGLSLGLGILTKAPFVIFSIVPIGIFLYQMRASRPQLVATKLLILGAVSLLINMRFFVQNVRLFNSPLGDTIKAGIGGHYTNESLSISSIVSNLLRNTFIHIPLPAFNQQVYLTLNYVHEHILHLGINDPRTTFIPPFKIQPLLFPQEDIAGNPIHLLLFLTALSFFAFNYKKVKDRLLKLLFLLSIVSFVLFSVILKWQPYHSRLHIPFFISTTIASTIILSRYARVLKGAVFSSTLIALLLILFNVLRPYVSYSLFGKSLDKYRSAATTTPESYTTKPRDKQYYNARWYWHEPYNIVSGKLAALKKDGPICMKFFDLFEYPMWVLIRGKNITNVINPPGCVLNPKSIYLLTLPEPRHIEGKKRFCEKTPIEHGWACLYWD